MYEDLKVIKWPDTRLKKISKPVERFDENLKALVEKMIGLMGQSRGVGLAAPQVGENIRLFVINPTGNPGDEGVYVNPVLSEADGEEEAEEGCLSLPGVYVDVVRSKRMKIQAQDVEGKVFEQTEEGYLARIWQHENDHLNGTLLVDRMGPVAKLANRKLLKELEEKFAEAHPEVVLQKKKRKVL